MRPFRIPLLFFFIAANHRDQLSQFGMRHVLIPARTSAGIRLKRARRSAVEREAPGKGRWVIAGPIYGDLTAIIGSHVAVATNCVS